MSALPPPTLPGELPLQRPHRGAVVLTLGILGLVVCFICGIIAWVMANADLREMHSGRMNPAGRQLTEAGRICGIVSACLGAIAVLGLCVWLAFAGLLFGGAAAAAAGQRSRAVPTLLP